LLQYFGNLHTPFVLKLADAEQGSSHHSDNDTCEDCEGAFPNVFCSFKGIASSSVKGANDASADDQADQNTCPNAIPDLAYESFVDCRVMFWAESLLKKGEEHRDDDARFQTLAEANEEDLISVSNDGVVCTVKWKPIVLAYIPGTAKTFGILRDLGTVKVAWFVTLTGYLIKNRRRI